MYDETKYWWLPEPTYNKYVELDRLYKESNPELTALDDSEFWKKYLLDRNHVPFEEQNFFLHAAAYSAQVNRVAKTEFLKIGHDKWLEETDVSTVFIGQSDIKFETMVFGGPFNEAQLRSDTWDEAIAQHAQTVDMLRRARNYLSRRRNLRKVRKWHTRIEKAMLFSRSRNLNWLKKRWHTLQPLCRMLSGLPFRVNPPESYMIHQLVYSVAKQLKEAGRRSQSAQESPMSNACCDPSPAL